MYQRLRLRFSVKGSRALLPHMEVLSESIEHNRAEISRFLLSRLGCADTAADVFQSIVENLLRRPPEPPIEDVRAFLYRAARNAVLNQRRAARNKSDFDVLATPLIEERDDRSPENIVVFEANLSKINDALLELPVLTRKIFSLYRLHGVKHKDIAEQLGISVSTVEKHVSKALSRCYICLRD